jgi:prepilin-type N-terminal cleavage/methylation domain-containing protein
MAKKRLKDKRKGFSLVEMLVVMALFAIVITISIGVIMQVFAVNQKVRSMSYVMDNISAGLEIITIDLRYGSEYQCEFLDGCDSLSFLRYDNTPVEYFLQDGRIWRSIDGNSPRALSTSDATIDSFLFYVYNDLLTVVVIKGHVGEEQDVSHFSLQTAVSQRQRYETF